MQRIQLIHWKEEETAERSERLRQLGYQVDTEIETPPQLLRRLGEESPAAVVIDLGRLPSQGRDMGLHIRLRKATRRLPLVFVGGAEEKVARIKEVLPDAVYTTWAEIEKALPQAIIAPPAEPVVPQSVFAPYAGKPLVEKLGIKEDSVVGLVDAPPDFRQTLGELPPGTRLHDLADGRCNLAIWFNRSAGDLQRAMPAIVAWAEHGPVWIAWPKKASQVATDLTQQLVRDTGLKHGLVDYKICAIDKTWSTLLFRRRRPDSKGEN